jgi:YhcG PDDEXK nuclease domain
MVQFAEAFAHEAIVATLRLPALLQPAAQAFGRTGAELGRFKAAYKSQMELYLHWLDKNERQPDELPPLGIVLCAERNREQVELLETRRIGHPRGRVPYGVTPTRCAAPATAGGHRVGTSSIRTEEQGMNFVVSLIRQSGRTIFQSLLGYRSRPWPSSPKA